MTNEATINKLITMKMSTMADAYRQQMEDSSMLGVSFEDRFGLLVDREYTTRKNNRLHRLIKNANFDQIGNINDINYESGRKLDKMQIQKLATCKYIQDKHNIIITGATGSGKSYMACALGIEACKHFYSTKYIRLPELLIEFAIARGERKFKERLKQYQSYTLLILDEWLLVNLVETEERDLLEIINARYNKVSTIFCSQFAPLGWYNKFPEAIIADSILDRIINSSYQIEIQYVDKKQDKSMREIYGIKNNKE
jgi:DNA replication protein DnaC